MAVLTIVQINHMHEEAMMLADEGNALDKQGLHQAAKGFFNKALELEVEVANAVNHGSEPSYTVIHSSAGCLAVRAGNLELAKYHAEKACSGTCKDEYVLDTVAELVSELESLGVVLES